VRVQTAPHGLLQARARTYRHHQRLVGALPDLDSARLIAMVTDSGLTGRGGAGFPTGRKLAAVSTRPGGVVVGNGAEGEPASSKDRVLLNEVPHLVLDGLQIAARAVRATSLYLYAPADLLRTTIWPAVVERDAPPAVGLIAAPDTFVSGQETAAVAAVEGKDALPTMPRVPVYKRGVQGRPTLVSNVETLCQLALIARFGPEWFQSCGSEDEPGARLVTVSGAVRRPAVYEVPGGSRLRDIVDWAGGSCEPLQAILIGGYHGAWLPWDASIGELTLSRSALRPYNAAPGAGVLVACPTMRPAGDCRHHVVSRRREHRPVRPLPERFTGPCPPHERGGLSCSKAHLRTRVATARGHRGRPRSLSPPGRDRAYASERPGDIRRRG
jgi:NADH:ubiquinone oxidoreductase subunit F (NADH-binding)